MERVFNAAVVQGAVLSPAFNPTVAQFQTTAAAETSVAVQWLVEV